MGGVTNELEQSITAVFVARRNQVRVRVGLCLMVAVMFQTITGVVPAVIWALSYIALQSIEFFLFRHVTKAQPFTRHGMVAFLAFLALTNFWFAAYGLVEAYEGGSYGLICAGLLWSGAILNAAIISGQSRLALACSMTPPLLHFFSVPFFVLADGGTLSAGFNILIAGLLNGVGAITIWSTGQKLMASAATAQEQARLAMVDVETGLANRYAVQVGIDDMPKPHNGIIVVAAIGIDRFVHLRGAIGHPLMVELLREMAARLAKLYTEAPVARLSVYTLGIIFIARDMDEAHETATRLQCALTAAVPLRDNLVDVGVTIGLSQPADAATSAVDMPIVDRAMAAIEQARAARKPVGRFDGALYGDPASNLSLMGEMLRGFDNGQISLHYQPKIALRPGAVVGVEALIRWNHPERGAVRPDLFVQMAEETGHIVALTLWVLRRAVEDHHRLRTAGHNMCVSVNLSGLVINDEACVEQALQASRATGGMLCLEITETAIIGNRELARKTLERMRAAGITIAIDDYGSGLSSLAYLKNIPADELKIDKAFVMNMASDPIDAVLVRSAVSLAHSLGLRSVAEGVEDKGTLELLRAMGCDMAQGYYIARPMPLTALIEHLARRERKAG